MPYVTDSTLNKLAIDSTQYPNTNDMLAGFMKGQRVSVTYYRRLGQGNTNIRTNIADYPTERDVLTTEYQKILNLEITLPKGFDFTTNIDLSNASITGQAMFYPGMNPSVGDIWLMGMGDGKIGVCQVSSVDISSWRQSKIYTVTFAVNSFADSSDIATFDASVTLTSVFTKSNMVGGTYSLLSEQTYLQLLQIRETRSALVQFYHATFFSTDLNSFLRPDCTYDPYATRFMTNKITLKDCRVRAKNLLGSMDRLYNQTLWARLEDRYNTTMYGLCAYATTMSVCEDRMSVFVTELVNNPIVRPITSPDGTTPYVYSPAFYAGNTTTMDVEELMVYTAITQRSAGDLAVLITNYLAPVWALPPDQQYYKIPIYIHLIDMALQSQYRQIDAPSLADSPQ